MSQFIEMFGTINSPRGKMSSLGELCHIQRGGSPRPIKDYITTDSNGLNWIKIGDTDDSMYIKKTEEKIKPSGLKKTRQVYAGDLLLSNSMSFGRPYILKIDGCIHDGWLVLHIKDESILTQIYLCAYLSQQSTYLVMSKLAAGGVVQNLNSEIVKKLPVILPPMQKQMEYISILEQADKSEFVGFKSQFIEEFGTMDSPKWETKTLPEISQNMDSKRIPIRSGNRKQGKYPYYGASGIVDYVDDYIFDEKILLVSEDGANLKERVAPIAFSSEGKVWVNNHAHVLRFNDYSLQKFVEYYLNYNKIDRYLTGTAQPKLNQDKLNNIPIPFPPEKQLRRFDCLTQQADKSEKCCEIRLAG